MTNTPSDIARPARRRKKTSASVQKQATDSLYKGLDRFGLAPILLIALAYVGHTQVIVPIASAYAEMVRTVGDTNQMIRHAIDQNNAEDGKRVALLAQAEADIKRVTDENRELNQKILATLGELMAIVRANNK